MDRLVRLAQVWNYLPGFRAAAETEHLPSAAERLGVTPSALSRTLSVLEKTLGRQLFDRRGRKLILNDAGRSVLAQVREAMRGLDDTLGALESEVLSGPVRIASSSRLATTLLVRALPELTHAHPQLEPVVSIAGPDALRDLLRGDVDLWLGEFASPHPGLQVERLGAFSNGVYCGPKHPLARRLDAPLDEILKHPFVGPPPLPGQAPDNWPAELERQVTTQVHQLLTALQICSQGRLLAALPDRVVSAFAVKLRRLRWEGMPPATVYAVRRRLLQPRDRARAVVEALQSLVD